MRFLVVHLWLEDVSSTWQGGVALRGRSIGRSVVLQTECKIGHITISIGKLKKNLTRCVANEFQNLTIVLDPVIRGIIIRFGRQLLLGDSEESH